MSAADGFSSPITLVITADDFGYCPSRNRAISDLYAQGAISQASLIVNSQSSPDAAQMAKEQLLPLGLHFNITEGQPISSSARCQTLCNQDGHFHGKMGLRHLHQAGLIAGEDVRSELEAQIDLFAELLGRPPSHVDGHQHIHVLPGLCEVFADVLRENRIAWTRVPNEVDLDNVTGQRRQFYDDVVRQSKLAAKIFTERRLRFASGFIGMSTMGRDMSLHRLLTMLNYHVTQPRDHVTQPIEYSQPTADVRLFEWMVHPGYPSKDEYLVFGSGPDDFARSSERQYEYDTLSSETLATFLADRYITLCSYESIE